jgi:hypothetical protein
MFERTPNNSPRRRKDAKDGLEEHLKPAYWFFFVSPNNSFLASWCLGGEKLFLLFLFCLLMSGRAWGLPPWTDGTLNFSKPRLLATLPWSDGSNQGVPWKGAEWLVVDSQGRYWLESDQAFGLYAPNGKYLRTITPLEKRGDDYGFYAMEALRDGRIDLLERLESPLEQLGKDNFELRSKPGSRLVVLKADGLVERDHLEVDPLQPHSEYYVENGGVYSIHDDGTYTQLDSAGPDSKDGAFVNYATIAHDRELWEEHAKTLPVFHSEDRITHDLQGKPHVEKNAKYFLMGRLWVEGTAPLAERMGKIYYKVICDSPGGFYDAVFIEDTVRKSYAFVDLVATDKHRNAVHKHALFVDPKGNLFEGVAQKDGYKIYEWNILP